MAKIVKRKRKLRVQALITLFFVFSIFAYIGSVTILRSYNYVLSQTAQEKTTEKDQLKVQVRTLETAVEEMSTYDYIARIAEKGGIKAYQANVKILGGE